VEALDESAIGDTVPSPLRESAVPQENGAFCGLSSAAAVLNAAQNVLAQTGGKEEKGNSSPSAGKKWTQGDLYGVLLDGIISCVWFLFVCITTLQSGG
jgi:hypothetical protein